MLNFAYVLHIFLVCMTTCYVSIFNSVGLQEVYVMSFALIELIINLRKQSIKICDCNSLGIIKCLTCKCNKSAEKAELCVRLTGMRFLRTNGTSPGDMESLRQDRG